MVEAGVGVSVTDLADAYLTIIPSPPPHQLPLSRLESQMLPFSPSPPTKSPRDIDGFNEIKVSLCWFLGKWRFLNKRVWG